MVPPSVYGFNSKKHLQRWDIKQGSFGSIVRFKWTKTIQFGDRNVLIPITAIPGSVLYPLLAYNHMCRKIPAADSSPTF